LSNAEWNRIKGFMSGARGLLLKRRGGWRRARGASREGRFLSVTNGRNQAQKIDGEKAKAYNSGYSLVSNPSLSAAEPNMPPSRSQQRQQRYCTQTEINIVNNAELRANAQHILTFIQAARPKNTSLAYCRMDTHSGDRLDCRVKVELKVLYIVEE
jgi:hypothetical protein